MSNNELMKEKTDLIKKINHLYQYPEFDETTRREVNERLQEIVRQLLNAMEQKQTD